MALPGGGDEDAGAVFLYGFTLDRDQAFNSVCDWEKVRGDGGVIKPTDILTSADGQTVYIQLVFPLGEFIEEIDVADTADVQLLGYGPIGDAAPRTSWEPIDVSTTPVVGVFSVVADGSVLSETLTITITPYTSLVDAEDDTIVDNDGDVINVVA